MMLAGACTGFAFMPTSVVGMLDVMQTPEYSAFRFHRGSRVPSG